MTPETFWGDLDEAVRERLIAVAKEEGLDPDSFYRMMANPQAGNGVAPIDLAKRGEVEQAIQIIRVTGHQGA